MQWPPNYQEEYLRRLRLIESMRPKINPEDGTDINYKTRTAIMQYYKTDAIAWISDWCITYDPRLKDKKTIPFILFELQIKFIQFILGCLETKHGGLVEKSRDMGASWLCCAIAVWLWIFNPGSAIGFGSRKEEYVDEKGNLKAIFPKIREILRYLPIWMLPVDYYEPKHAPYMRIMNPENGSIIMGEAGDNIGRGGRTTLYFKDEAAHYERPELIEAALGDNTNVQIDISSVNGTANVFYKRRMAGEIWYPNKEIEKDRARIFIMDWREHPNKNQEWHDIREKQAEREGLLHIFRQEVDRDYSSSIDRIIIDPLWIRSAIDSHKQLNFTAQGAKVGAQDVADGGRDKNALALRKGVVLQFAESWGGEAGKAAHIALPACVSFKANELYYDCIGVGSGFKTSINNLQDLGKIPSSLKIYPWDAGGGVLEPEENIIAYDMDTPLNKDFYYNIKAQAWWSLRTRFYKTYKAVNKIEKYEPEELISIDSRLSRLQEIIVELSQPQYKYSPDGRVMVDKKPEGANSPNLADAIVMCYFPCKELSILDVL